MFYWPRGRLVRQKAQTTRPVGTGAAVFLFGDRLRVSGRNKSVSPGKKTDIHVALVDVIQALIERQPVLGHVFLLGQVTVAAFAQHFDHRAAMIEQIDGRRRNVNPHTVRHVGIEDRLGDGDVG